MTGKNILIVDDSPTALAFAAGALQKAGYSVFTTSDIWIAHQVLQLQPQLILMDVHMGSARSGPVVVDALNRISIRERMKILFYSSRPEPELANLAVEHGADGYICKQHNPSTLVNQVSREIGEPLAA